MSKAIETIMATLNSEFATWDAQLLEAQLVWAADRAKAVREFEAVEENIKMRRSDVWGFYAKVHAIAGGKTWYAVVRNSESQRNVFVKRNCEAVSKARNIKIAKQLVKAGVTTLTHAAVTRSPDGFQGIFKVETNDGVKFVTIHTIFAGGYNVQCAHVRTLVKIK